MTAKQVWGIAGILLGIAAWLGAGALALSSFTSAATFQAPGSTSVNLPIGTWSVFQMLSPDTTALTPGQVSQERSATVEQITVTGPNGQSIPLTCLYCGDVDPITAPVDLALANGIASFTADVAGDYEVNVAEVNSVMAVADPVGKLNSAIGYLTFLGFAGGALIVVGIVLVVRGRDRSVGGGVVVANGPRGGDRAHQSPSGPSAPAQNAPPGWYPNPFQPGTDSKMWWDGRQWTSNWR